MDRTIKGVIAVVLCAAIAAVAAYGSYLPMTKAQIYIGMLQGFQSQPPSSLEDLETRIAVPLDYPSPIGQEEIVRNTANNVLSLLQRGLDATSTAQLIDFLNGYFDPIIARGRGMSFGQDVYLEGAINEIAFAQTGQAKYLDQAKQYYELGEKLGPNRPQTLYGLFDIYRAMGDATNTKLIAEKILANWPSDAQRIDAGMAQFFSATSSVKKK